MAPPRKEPIRDFPASEPWAGYLDGAPERPIRGPRKREPLNEARVERLRQKVANGGELTIEEQFLAETFGLLPPKITGPQRLKEENR